MNNIDVLITRMQNINFRELMQISIQENPKPLQDTQRIQMLHGENALGKKIGKYKNKKYAQKKYQQNPLAGLGNKDLKLSGDFQNEIIVDARDYEVVFSSTDPKTADILAREGEDVFGLNKNYAAQYGSGVLADDVNKRIKIIMNGGVL